MEPSTAFQHVGLALGLGLLVGLQRERAESQLAGIRTYPLITVLGTLCALLADRFGGWILGLGLVGLAALIVVGNLAKLRAGLVDPGLTGEVTMLSMYAVGAYLVGGAASVAVALSGAIAVLLHLKPELHSFASRIEDRDFKAAMQFVLITLVVLPVLPDVAYGPYEALNPYRIWLLVVLIVGINLGGYVLYRRLGDKVGALLAGVLGGLISSTATTVSHARRSRQAKDAGGLPAAVIAIASAVALARVLVLIGLTSPKSLPAAGPPIGALLGLMALLSGGMWLACRREPTRMPAHANPSELRSALSFAALFALVLLAVAFAKDRFGDRGLYVVAVLSGLTDMDAITLSTMQMAQAGHVGVETGWRLVLVAALSNLAFKGAVVAVLGGRGLLRRIAIPFGLTLAAGAALLAWWPAGAQDGRTGRLEAREALDAASSEGGRGERI